MTIPHIYTRQGDEGATSLAHGERVPKDDIRIETNGQLDELNALLGLVIARYPRTDNETLLLRGAQRQLTQLMALIAGIDDNDTGNSLAEETLRLEQATDQAMGNRLFRFQLPGSDPLEALLHLARAKTRTCERRLVTLSRCHPLHPAVIPYVNRLSDYLYALAVKRT